MDMQHILLYEILHRLPTKTLMRFKCINKFFQTYISSKDFINLHLRHSITSGTNRFVIFLAAEGDNSNTDHLYSLDLSSVHSPELQAHHCLELPKPISSGKSDIHVVGCCNGLICLRSYRRFDYNWLDKKNNNSKIALKLMIFNPCTGMFKSNISLTFSDLCYRTNMICTSIGFGYDSVNDDYKIVVVDYYNDENQWFDLDFHYSSFNYWDNLVVHRKTLVYSLKADSWRCVDESSDTLMRHPDHYYGLCNNGVLINNHLVHLLYRYPTNKETRIGVFNLETEKWVDNDLPLPNVSLPLPYLVDNDLDCANFYLGVYDGCLCFTINLKGKHEIWMMKEYGVHESWMKFVSIPLRRCFVVFPNDCGTRGEILLRKNLQSTNILFMPCYEFDNHTLNIKSSVWYDIEDKTMERFLTFTGAPLRHKVLALTVGSLVPVYGGCQAIEIDEGLPQVNKHSVMN